MNGEFNRLEGYVVKLNIPNFVYQTINPLGFKFWHFKLLLLYKEKKNIWQTSIGGAWTKIPRVGQMIFICKQNNFVKQLLMIQDC